MELRKQVIAGCCIGLYGIGLYIFGYFTGKESERLDNEIEKLEETKERLYKMEKYLGLEEEGS